MSKAHQLSVRELAMRSMEITRAHVADHPDFMMADIANRLTARYGISRASAFRYVRVAVDVLAIHYDHNERMRKQQSFRVADGIAEARSTRAPARGAAVIA
jgi:hypothetical protein